MPIFHLSMHLDFPHLSLSLALAAVSATAPAAGHPASREMLPTANRSIDLATYIKPLNHGASRK